MTDNLAAALGALIKAAADFAFHAGAHCKADRPEDYEKFRAAFEAGAGIRVVTDVAPTQAARLVVVIEGKEHGFFRADAREVLGPQH